MRHARASIRAHLAGEPHPVYADPSSAAAAQAACFVTLRVRATRELRGCIGQTEPRGPLHEAVGRAAVSAAAHDPRFPPVSLAELEGLTMDISVLSPMERIRASREIVIGEHGVFVRTGAESGLLLPQVAPAWGWSAEELLRQTCRKAELPEDAWRKPETEVYRFSAQVFEE